MCDDDVAALVVDNGAFIFCEINNCDREKSIYGLQNIIFLRQLIIFNGSLKKYVQTLII